MAKYHEESLEKSLFNEGTLQIQRLHNLWLEAELKAKKNRLNEWDIILDSVYRELSSDIEKLKNGTDIKNENKALKKLYYKLTNPKSRYLLLDYRHQMLKKAQDDAGKGTKRIREDSEHFL